jgi:hypothetical protein
MKPANRFTPNFGNVEIKSPPRKTARKPCAQSLSFSFLILDRVAQNFARLIFHAAAVTGGSTFEPYLHVFFQIAHDEPSHGGQSCPHHLWYHDIKLARAIQRATYDSTRRCRLRLTRDGLIILDKQRKFCADPGRTTWRKMQFPGVAF